LECRRRAAWLLSLKVTPATTTPPTGRVEAPTGTHMSGSSTPFCLAPEHEQLPPTLVPYDPPSLPSSSGDEDDDDENEEEAMKEQLVTLCQKSST
jgi:hypothetical protein